MALLALTHIYTYLVCKAINLAFLSAIHVVIQLSVLLSLINEQINNQRLNFLMRINKILCQIIKITTKNVLGDKIKHLNSIYNREFFAHYR